MLALTYNEKPAKKLEKILKRTGVKASHFHKICRQLLAPEIKNKIIIAPEGWVEHSKDNFQVINQLGTRFIAKEISWIIEMGIKDLDEYLHIERKGRGKEGRLGQDVREEIYKVLGAYREFLTEQNQIDWADIPSLVLQSIDEKKVTLPSYDVILIDEAQDFAPSWIEVVKRLLNPEQGLLFLADDPMQSIYRLLQLAREGGACCW